MAKRCKGFNSKCFLFTYLIFVGILLVLWVNRLPLMHEDQREIPADLQAYIASPPRSLPSFSLNMADESVLTNKWFEDKWSFVYFTHSHCLPECQPALEYMNRLQLAFANKDFNFLAIGIDGKHETANDLASFLDLQQYKLTAVTASENKVEALAKTFIALFLRTDFSGGRYQIEQEHHIFVVDPKGRVYATFIPPYTSTSIQRKFLKLRLFYARSE
ncbi:MAG: photosynthetic protein synthase I [Methylophaga sp.]|nr:MAG: photosynthetic protein synthase I [Methylophaga sp.]